MERCESSELSVAVEAATVPDSWIVTMTAPGRPGTLALFAGVLTLTGLNICWASVRLRPDGVVEDMFEVTGVMTSGPEADGARAIFSMLANAWEGRMDVPAEIARVRTSGRRAIGVPVCVEFDTNSSITTGIRLRAADRPGLLHDAARSISMHGLRMRSITVLSANGIARDNFRVVDEHLRPPADPDLLDRVRQTLEVACR